MVILSVFLVSLIRRFIGPNLALFNCQKKAMLQHLGIVTQGIYSRDQGMLGHQKYTHIIEEQFNAVLVREELAMWLLVRVVLLVVTPSGLILLSHILLDITGPQQLLGLDIRAEKFTTLLALAFTMKFSVVFFELVAVVVSGESDLIPVAGIQNIERFDDTEESATECYEIAMGSYVAIHSDRTTLIDTLMRSLRCKEGGILLLPK